MAVLEKLSKTSIINVQISTRYTGGLQLDTSLVDHTNADRGSAGSGWTPEWPGRTELLGQEKAVPIERKLFSI